MLPPMWLCGIVTHAMPYATHCAGGIEKTCFTPPEQWKSGLYPGPQKMPEKSWLSLLQMPATDYQFGQARAYPRHCPNTSALMEKHSKYTPLLMADWQ